MPVCNSCRMSVARMRKQQQPDSPAGVPPAHEMRGSHIRTVSNSLSVDEIGLPPSRRHRGPGHIPQGNVVSVPSSSITSRQDGVDSMDHEDNSDSPHNKMEANGEDHLQGAARVIEHVVAEEQGGLEDGFDGHAGNEEFENDDDVEERVPFVDDAVNDGVRETHQASRGMRHVSEHQMQATDTRQGRPYEIRASELFPGGDSSDYDYLDAFRHSCINFEPPIDTTPTPSETKRLLAKLLRGEREGTEVLFQQCTSMDLRDIHIIGQPFEIDQLRPLPQGTGQEEAEEVEDGWHYVQVGHTATRVDDRIVYVPEKFAFSQYIKQEGTLCWQITCKCHRLGPFLNMGNACYDLPGWQMNFSSREDAIHGMLFHWAFSSALWQYLDPNGYNDQRTQTLQERQQFDASHLRDDQNCNEADVKLYEDYVLMILNDLHLLNEFCRREWELSEQGPMDVHALITEQGLQENLKFVQDSPGMAEWLTCLDVVARECHPTLSKSFSGPVQGQTICIKSLITYWVRHPGSAELQVKSFRSRNAIVFHGVHMVRALLCI